MKKIGVCCEYKHRNYGSMLQALATVLQLEKLGYDYEIINYTRKLTPDLLIRSLARIPEEIHILLRRYIQLQKRKKHPEVEHAIHLRDQLFKEFSTRHFTKISEPFDTFSQLQSAAASYSAVMVGSDQLWVPRGYSTGFFNLLFVPENIPKIAYATSFGVSEIPESKRKIAKRFLERIDYIGVREIRASEIVKELTGRDVPTVVDPTLLLSGEEWEKIIPVSQVKGMTEEKYIFCYFLGNNPEQRREAEKLSRETGYRIVFIPHLDEFISSDMGFGDEQLFEIDPEGFVNLIRKAEFICTDSFHGSVFSILNHKRFITFERFKNDDKNSRNSRIISLLSQTGLTDRRFQGDILSQMFKPIDYNLVEEKIEEMRKKSLEYLSDALLQSVGSKGKENDTDYE